MSKNEVAHSAFAFFAALLSGASGTGGGALFIPLESMKYQDPHIFVPSTKCATFGTALGAFVVNLATALKTRASDIDFMLVSYLQAAIVLGCLCGLMLNIALEANAILVLMIVVLLIVCVKTVNHSRRQYEDARTTLFLPNLSDSAMHSYQTGLRRSCYELANIGALWVGNIALLVRCGGVQSLFCSSGRNQLFALLDVGFVAAHLLFNYTRLSGRLFLRASTGAKYIALAFLAGTFSALTGVGGGIIYGPLLLSLGMSPLRVVSTLNLLVLFTVSTNIVLYFLADRITEEIFQIFYVTFAGGLIGILYVRLRLKSRHSQYKISLLLAFAILVGLVYELYLFFNQPLENMKKFNWLGSQVCQKSHEIRLSSVR